MTGSIDNNYCTFNNNSDIKNKIIIIIIIVIIIVIVIIIYYYYYYNHAQSVTIWSFGLYSIVCLVFGVHTPKRDIFQALII